MIMIKVIVVIIVLIVLIGIHIPFIVIKKLIDKIPLCYKMCV